MSDIQLMTNLLSTRAETEYLFKDVQIRELNDENKGDYSAGQINFNTKNASKSYNVPAQDDILVPFTINVTGILSATNCLGTVSNCTSTIVGPATVNDQGLAGPSNTGGDLDVGSRGSVAFKHSSLSLFNGVDISLNNGGTGIVSDLKNISLINQIRMMVQNNQDWARTYAKEFAFAKDTLSAIPSDGFNERQAHLYDLSNCTYYCLPGVVAGAGKTGYISSIQVVVSVPLKYIHNFFANQDFPSRGIEWLYNFHMCKEFNPNQKYYGFCFAGGVPDNVKYTLGKAKVGDTNYTSCKLKYKTVALPDEFQLKVNKDMASGALSKRVVKFAATEIYDDVVNFSGDLSSHNVATGIVKPIRLWLLGFNAGALRSQLVPNVTNLNLKTLNCEINTENRFNGDLNSPYDFYSQVKDQMQELASSPDRGSLIDYLDFYQANPNQFNTDEYGLYSYYCIDLAHTQNRVDDQAVSIILNTMKTSHATSQVALDYVILVEREVVCRMSYSGNNVEIAVGSNLQ